MGKKSIKVDENQGFVEKYEITRRNQTNKTRLCDRNGFAFYWNIAKNEIKTKNSSLFRVFASAISIGRLIILLFD